MDFSKHSMLTNASAMQNIAKPLNQELGLNYFNFIRNYNDNSRICLTTSAQWADYFCSNKLYLIAPFEKDKADYSNDQMIFWPSMQDHIIYREALNSNIKHALTLVKRGPEFTEFFHFGSDRFENTMAEIIVSKQDVLNLFIMYFKETAQKLITRSDLLVFSELKESRKKRRMLKPKDLSLQNDSNHLLNLLDLKKYYLGAEFGDAYLTRKEILVLRWVIAGKSANEIALLLNSSFRTIQEHVQNIKRKTNCFKITELCYRIGASEIGKLFLKLKIFASE